jgi:hypothetical protein
MEFICSPHQVDCYCSWRVNYGSDNGSIECTTLNAIKSLIPDDIMRTHQFQITGRDDNGREHTYRIDLYFPDHRIAVECDEEGHRQRDPVYEADRQRFITDKLGCVFVRYNPHDPSYTPEGVADSIMAAVTAVKDDAAYRKRRLAMRAEDAMMEAQCKAEEAYTQFLHEKYTAAGMLPHRDVNWSACAERQASSMIDRLVYDAEAGSYSNLEMPYAKKYGEYTRLMYRTSEGAREWPYAIPDGLPTPRGYLPPEVVLDTPPDAIIPDLEMILRRQRHQADGHYREAMRSCRAIEDGDDEDVHASVFKGIADESEATRISCTKGIDNLIKRAYGDWSKVPEEVSSVIPAKFRADTCHVPSAKCSPKVRSLAERLRDACLKYCRDARKDDVLSVLTAFWDDADLCEQSVIRVARMVFSDSPVSAIGHACIVAGCK